MTYGIGGYRGSSLGVGSIGSTSARNAETSVNLANLGAESKYMIGQATRRARQYVEDAGRQAKGIERQALTSALTGLAGAFGGAALKNLKLGNSFAPQGKSFTSQASEYGARAFSLPSSSFASGFGLRGSLLNQ